MNTFKLFNLALRFLLELCMLAAVGCWGFKIQSGWVLKILFGIGLPLLIAILWGTFLSPKATRPLHGASFLTLELVLFSSGAFALFAVGELTLGWIYTIAVVVNKTFLTILR